MFAILKYKRTPDAAEIAIGTGTVAISLLAGTLNAIVGTILWVRMPGRR